MSRNELSSKRSWQKAFTTVIDLYLETKATNGVSKAIDYTRMGNGSGGTFNPRIVRPTKSDFICDVELIVKRALSLEELASFRDIYILGHKGADVEVRDNIEQKVGKMLTDREVYPFHKYFRPVYVTPVVNNA